MTLSSPPSPGPADRAPTLRVARDIADIAADWAALEREGVATPFQSLAFVSAWIASGAGSGRPLLVTGWTGERLDFVWPFEVTRRGGLTTARWLGDSHASYGFGVWRRGAVPAGDVIARLSARLARAEGIDLFVLDAMPRVWEGLDLPFAAAVPCHAALDDGHRFRLMPRFDDLIAARNGGHKRKKIKQKEKLLHAAGGYAIARAEGEAEIRATLSAFFAQKAASLAAVGIGDPFAAPAVRAFYEALALGTGGEAPLLELTRLSAGGEIRAVLGSIAWGDTSHQLFASAARDDLSRASPGETLFFRHIEAACGRGFAHYDMGVGSERYKASWCDEVVPLVSAIVPVGLEGRIAGAVIGALGRLKARIRRDAALWAKVKALRARVMGRGVEAPED